MLETLLLAATLAADQPAIDCSACSRWNETVEPFRIHGDTYYVGVHGLSAVLVTGDAGHVLIDGGLPQSAPIVEANIAKLGFAIGDVKVILNSHAHFDHAGGIAALARASGAEVRAGAPGVSTLAAGAMVPGDPQYVADSTWPFPPVANARVLADGETIDVGGLAIVAHATPGHTPGGLSYTWRSCVGEDCRDFVYGDSLTAVSMGGYRFTDHPELVATFRSSFDVVRKLDCDVLIPAHPDFATILADHGRRPEPGACVRYVEAMEKRLADKLASEAAATLR